MYFLFVEGAILVSLTVWNGFNAKTGITLLYFFKRLTWTDFVLVKNKSSCDCSSWNDMEIIPVFIKLHNWRHELLSHLIFLGVFLWLDVTGGVYITAGQMKEILGSKKARSYFPLKCMHSEIVKVTLPKTVRLCDQAQKPWKSRITRR